MRAGPILELWEAFAAGIYLSFAYIHLDLWLRRRERLGNLWLAAASLGALLVDVTGMAQRYPLGGHFWIEGLNALGVAVATAAIFELVASLGGAPPPRSARILQVSLLALAPMAALPLPVLSRTLVAGCFVLLIWALAKALAAARAGDRDSGKVAHGLVALIVLLLADLLAEIMPFSFSSGMPILGFAILFVASARSLHDRFGREEEASRTDPLTGLLNRRGFLEAGDGALVRGRRSGRPLAIVLADLDHFKRVNDALGHAAGDFVLKAVAAAIRSSLRGQDVAARWGGEEFILLLPDTDRPGARQVAETVRRAVAELPVVHESGSVAVTLSAGAAEHRSGTNLEETIACADAALLQAKQEGRNRVV